MNWAQRSVSPTRATLIYTGEPVWAGIFGRLAGERLPAAGPARLRFDPRGVLVSELKWKTQSAAQFPQTTMRSRSRTWPIAASHNIFLLTRQRRLSWLVFVRL